ncbi:MAG: hypothetical protein KatS3mg010_0327 [Acidimicrobiia bacterium]|nr:MAG: hypothetical protein KatS3mg010_0327 [Acidimicrobiia bacterium]
MCSRASRSVAESFSFCETAWASWPFVSSSRSSSVRTPLGRVLQAAAEDDDLLLEALDHLLELVDLRLVLGESALVLGRHRATSSVDLGP